MSAIHSCGAATGVSSSSRGWSDVLTRVSYGLMGMAQLVGYPPCRPRTPSALSSLRATQDDGARFRVKTPAVTSFRM